MQIRAMGVGVSLPVPVSRHKPRALCVRAQSSVNSVIRASANDRDFWKEELEDKVADVRNVRRVVEKAPVVARTDHDRGGARARSKSEDDRVGTHPQRGPDGRKASHHGDRVADLLCVQQGARWMCRSLPIESRSRVRVLFGATQVD